MQVAYSYLRLVNHRSAREKPTDSLKKFSVILFCVATSFPKFNGRIYKGRLVIITGPFLNIKTKAKRKCVYLIFITICVYIIYGIIT